MSRTERAAALQLLQQLPHGAPADRVECARRLVQQEQRRRSDQRLRDAEALLHALRHRLDPAVARVGQADQLEQLGALGLAAAGAREPLVQREQLVRRVPAGEAKQLGEVAHLPPRVERAGAGAADLGPSAGRPDEPAGDLDQRRLARPVRAEQADELALVDLEVDPAERGRRAVALLERADGERRAHLAGGVKNFV